MFFYLLACAPEVALTPVTKPCENVDLANLPPSELTSATEGSIISVWLTNVEEPSGLEFQPSLEPEGRVLVVKADWTGTPGDANFCYQPTVEIEGLKGKLEVRWYLTPEDGTAYDTLTVKGE